MRCILELWVHTPYSQGPPATFIHLVKHKFHKDLEVPTS